MAEYGLGRPISAAKHGAEGEGKSGGGKVAAKYRNSSTGESWSGRGLQPRWLKAALAERPEARRFRRLTRASAPCGALRHGSPMASRESVR